MLEVFRSVQRVLPGVVGRRSPAWLVCGVFRFSFCRLFSVLLSLLVLRVHIVFRIHVFVFKMCLE